MKKIKVLSAVLAAIMMGSAFTGCGSPAAQSSTQPAEQSSQPAQSAAEAVTLRFMWWGGDERHEATIAAINQYMKKNPNVKIEAEYGGYEGYQQKISTQLAGGTEPDLMQLDQPWMVEFTTQNPDMFVDLNTYQDTIDMTGFEEAILKNYSTYNEKLVGLPTGTAAMIFMCNKKVLDEAGVTFGDKITWDDLIEQGKKVNQKNPENYLLNLNNGVAYFVTRVYLYQLTGTPLVNDDYTVAFTQDQLKQAFEMTKRLYEEKVVIPYEEAALFQSDATSNPKWNSNQLGGWLSWSSQTSQQAWGEENIVMLPYPQLPDAKQPGLIVRPSQLLSISSRSKAQEECAKFMNYFFNDEEAIVTLKDTRSIPANSNARDILTEKGLITQAAIDGVDLAMKNPGNPESALSTNTEVTDSITNSLEKLIYGQYDADAAATECIALMQDVLNNLKASRG